MDIDSPNPKDVGIDIGCNGIIGRTKNENKPDVIPMKIGVEFKNLLIWFILLIFLQ